jgi:hypothetical protein
MTTPLNTTKVEVLTIIIGKDYVKYPSLMKEDVGKQNKKKEYCLFYKDKGNGTKSVLLWKKNERFIAKDYFQQFVK